MSHIIQQIERENRCMCLLGYTSVDRYIEVGASRLEKQGTRHIECCANRFSG